MSIREEIEKGVNIKKLFKRIGIDYEKVQHIHNWREDIEQP